MTAISTDLSDPPTAPAYANGYPVTLATGTRAFIWRYLGQNSAGR